MDMMKILINEMVTHYCKVHVELHGLYKVHQDSIINDIQVNAGSSVRRDDVIELVKSEIIRLKEIDKINKEGK